MQKRKQSKNKIFIQNTSQFFKKRREVTHLVDDMFVHTEERRLQLVAQRHPVGEKGEINTRTSHEHFR